MDYQEPQFPRPSDTDIRNISGLIPASAATPTGTPRNFFQQLRIVSGVLYFYDTILNAWHSATATPAGANTHVQYNDGGLFGGDAGLKWDKTDKTLTITSATPGIAATLLAIFGQINGLFFTHDDGGDGSYSINTNRPLSISGSTGGLRLNNASTPTNSNDGFIFIPYMNGTPTGTPFTTPALVYDTAANKLWAYQGGSWRSVTFT